MRSALVLSLAAGLTLPLWAAPRSSMPGSSPAATQSKTAAIDASIQSYLQKKLDQNSHLKGVRAHVADRVVTLSGTVNSYRDDIEAAHMARQIASVDGVIDRIAVNAPHIPDQKLKKQLAERLTYDRIGEGQTFNYLTVGVKSGHVTVGGEVRSYADRDSALDIIADTQGVRGVTDNIKVAPTSIMDDQIRFLAARAIYGNPELSRYADNPAHPIRILVNNGHVTLDGVVASQMDKQLAYNAVNSIGGVFSVTNNLVVAGQKTQAAAR